MYIKVDGGKIYGELIEGSKDVLVIFVSGSGPTDLNGNTPALNGKNDSLLQLAQELEKLGISTFRYDKRTAGESVKTFESLDGLTFDDFVQDLKYIIYDMKESGYHKVILLGHSQGSLISMLASREAVVDGFISLAGPGENIGDVLLKQYGANPKVFKDQISIVKSLMNGETVPEGEKIDPTFNSVNQNFLLSWMKYDPEEEIRSIEFPVLIIQGRKDLQVGENDARILKDNCKDSELVFIDDMNHVLKVIRSDADNTRSYVDPSYEIHPKLIKAVSEYVNKIVDG